MLVDLSGNWTCIIFEQGLGVGPQVDIVRVCAGCVCALYAYDGAEEESVEKTEGEEGPVDGFCGDLGTGMHVELLEVGTYRTKASEQSKRLGICVTAVTL